MKKETQEYDALLIGGGIMSTTLATLLKILNPNWKICIVEKMAKVAMESSNGTNNAGTGHSGFCELNYDLHKAIETCESFEKSKQFWTYLVKEKYINANFINQVPHISFVTGQENVDLLKQRWSEMKKICLFADMEFSNDPAILKEWMPLMLHGRDRGIPMAATRVKRGTDIDFGSLTNQLASYLNKNGVKISYYQQTLNINKNGEKWDIVMSDRLSSKTYNITSKFVFIGAGGATLTLLEKSKIPEGKGYGGFPVSGQFLICKNPKIVSQHNVKVYGKPEIGSPPMSVPHLDKRIINGEEILLFGPYAGFSSKFLKNGHWTDFFKSLRLNNVFTILSAGLRNLGLSKYLIKEVTKTNEGRFKTLLTYYPNANPDDWALITAGQRVQVIKKDKGIPTIEFGTEIVSSVDGSLSAILGASPGASVSVFAMLSVIEKCFSNTEGYSEWVKKINEMIPSYNINLHENEELFKKTILGL